MVEETIHRAGAYRDFMEGEKLPVPPISSHWSVMGRWHETFRWKWLVEEHINVLEAKAVVNAIRHKVRRISAWGARHLIFVDSQVTMGSLTKGRSSRPGMNYSCRKLGALTLLFGIKVYLRFVPTKRNYADGPSRGFGLGIAPESVPQRTVLPHTATAPAPRGVPERFRNLAG